MTAIGIVPFFSNVFVIDTCLEKAELAEMVENCKDNIRRLERNKFINPTYQLHHDFTEFFEKPVEEILGYEEI